MGVIAQAPGFSGIIGQLSLTDSGRAAGYLGLHINRAALGDSTAWPQALDPKVLLSLKSDEAKQRNNPFCRVLAGSLLKEGSLPTEAFPGSSGGGPALLLPPPRPHTLSGTGLLS